jgi:hypothetical protein
LPSRIGWRSRSLSTETSSYEIDFRFQLWQSPRRSQPSAVRSQLKKLRPAHAIECVAAAEARGGVQSEDREPFTAQRFFAALPALSPLRVISQCGPSTFEAIGDFGAHEIAGGFLNAITPSYHWHVRLGGVRRIQSHDELHARSGRRVLFFTLSADDASPFLRIYLHRERGAEFEPAREKAFLALHARLGAGVALEGAR